MTVNVTYPTLGEAKSAMIGVGKELHQRGFTAANDGNFSCKLSPDTILTTPTGVSKGSLTEEMLVITTLEGDVLFGSARPSSELQLHLRIYRENPSILAVVHAHPPMSTALAVAGIAPQTELLPEGIVQLGTVPIAPYATPSTLDVAQSVAPFCHQHCAILLSNHGAVTWGGSLKEACYRMETLEHISTVTIYTRGFLGAQRPLSSAQITTLTQTVPCPFPSPKGAHTATNTQAVLPHKEVTA